MNDYKKTKLIIQELELLKNELQQTKVEHQKWLFFSEGISHDLNNIIGVISGNIELMRDKITSKEFNEMLKNIEEGCLRATDLAQQLASFAKVKSIKKIDSIEDVVKNTASFILKGTIVKCKFFLDDTLWHTKFNYGQIHQVISNLIINALQAMPRGGMIKIYIQNITIKAPTTISLSKGKYVKLSIEDQGTGICEENLKKIFAPYFTTKHAGSGLGLAICDSIIKKHGGLITADSSPSGSAFHVYFPAS